MRVRTLLFALVILGLPGDAYAGNVYGTLWVNGRPVGQGMPIDITCGATAYKPVTEADGSYRVFLREKGRCNVTVSYGGRGLSTEIISYDSPIKYDFEVVQQNGSYILRRK